MLPADNVICTGLWRNWLCIQGFVGPYCSELYDMSQKCAWLLPNEFHIIEIRSNQCRHCETYVTLRNIFIRKWQRLMNWYWSCEWHHSYTPQKREAWQNLSPTKVMIILACRTKVFMCVMSYRLSVYSVTLHFYSTTCIVQLEKSIQTGWKFHPSYMIILQHTQYC
jgi:hypothetical protein